MTLARLDVRFVALDALVEEANTRHVVVALTDADTIVAVGSLHDRLTKPLGVWLELSEDYSAQMAARDVEALLSDDEVNFTNGVATLVGAYNRPAPPAPIAVWSWDGALLRRGEEALREASSASGRDFDETTYP